MKKMLCVAVTALALGALALPVHAAEMKADQVAARVNGKEIKQADVIQEIRFLGEQAQQVPLQAIYPQILEKLIITKIVSDKGYEQKLDSTEEVKERVKRAEAQIVADVYVHNTIQPRVTDEKIKARYDQLKAKFKPEDEVRARHILVASEDDAKAIIKQIKDGGDFAKIAGEKSKDTGSAKQGGDLGYFGKEVMVKAFAEAAFKMKVGEVSDKPIKTEFGYHIIKVEDRRKSAPPALEEVKDQIAAQIGQEEVSVLIKELEAKAKIERFNIDGTPAKEKEAVSKKGDKKEETEKKAK